MVTIHHQQTSAAPCAHFPASHPHMTGSVFGLATLQMHCFLNVFGNACKNYVFKVFLQSSGLVHNSRLELINCYAPSSIDPGLHGAPEVLNGV